MAISIAPPPSPLTGTISSTGLGSGLDVKTIVPELVAADTQAQSNQLSQEQGSVNAQLSAVGTISSAASSLNDAITALASSGLGTRAVNVSDTSVLAATAANNAPMGTHNVVVQSLAQAQELTSKAFATADTAAGSGTLAITVGGNSFSVNLGTGSTLNQIRDAINTATGNTGVTASIVTADDGAHLMLSSNSTGTASTITVTASGGDGGLAALDYGNGATGGLSQYQAASDATLTIDGFSVTSPTNTVSNAVQGLTLNLAKAAPGETVSVGIAQDTSAVSTAVSNFVQAYNTLTSAIGKQTGYDSSTQTAGALLGNMSIATVSRQVRSIVGSAVTGNAFGTLSQIGITFNDDGSMTLDSSKLTSALTQNSSAVNSLLTGTGGIGAQLQTNLNNYLSSNGLFTSQTNAFQSQLNLISTQQQALQQRSTQLTAMYTAQFSALDTLMTQMQATSSYLTQALSNLPGLSSSSKSS